MYHRILRCRNIIFVVVCCFILFFLSIHPQHSQTASYNNFSRVIDCNTLKTTIIDPLELEPMKDNDFQQLIDLDNFDFILNVPACHKSMIIVVVHSAPKNFLNRKTIRQTWGSEDPRARVIFLLAAVGDLNLQNEILKEHKEFGDIVQGNFVDAYRNMTYKHVSAFKWFVYYCSEAKYLIKTDDDVLVNTPLLYNYLEVPQASSKKFHREKLMFCRLETCSQVLRSNISKWSVTYDEYDGDYYPNYCPGFFILYSADIIKSLYQVAQSLPYFWIDDVHITGTVASKLGIAITPAKEFYLSEANQTFLLNDHELPTVPLFFFSQPETTDNEIKILWQKVIRGDSTAGLI